jgi:hypothetical protein
MDTKGIYRTKTAPSGAEYAYIDYGEVSGIGEIARARYESQGYKPPFGELPTKEEYDAKQATLAKSDNANRT